MRNRRTDGWQTKWEVMRLESQLRLISALACALQAKARALVFPSSAESSVCLPTPDLLLMLQISLRVLRFDIILALYASRLGMFFSELANKEAALLKLA